MKNLIYQYWDGKLTVGCMAGVECMKKYAHTIGAKYLFEKNPKFVNNLGSYSPHYGAFKPIYTDKFHQYDNVLFADTDVFPIKDLEENIFEDFGADVGVCTEPDQPTLRLKTAGRITSALDEQWARLIETKWNVKMPRTSNGLLKVYNSGVVLYSITGLIKAKNQFVPFKKYVDMIKATSLNSFYTCDQPYLHAMLEVANLNWIELDNGWNSYVHYTKQLHIDNGARRINDTRTKNTKFVHIQLAGADHWDATKLNRIANLPQLEWNL